MFRSNATAIGEKTRAVSRAGAGAGMNGADLALAMRFALREMRGGLSGFFVFLACIALGVAAIAGVNSVARAINGAVAAQGQELLGADIRFEIDQRRASEAEFAWLENLGTLALSANMRSMARLPDGSDQALVELKAVDDEYPLYGTLVTEPELSHDDLFGLRDGAYGMVAPPLLFDRLDIALGDRVMLGTQPFELRAELVTEPDMVSESFGFAPRMMISLEALEAAGLVQPGSMVEHVYKLRLWEGTNDDELQALREEAGERFPEAGWSIRTRLNAAPALSSSIERFSQFLTLVGLTALVVGGVGVANAVRAYVDSKRYVIATFKSLGASGRFVVSIYLIQILLIAFMGIAGGLVLGALMPFGASAVLSSILPVPSQTGIYPSALGLAALFGILTTLAFAILPLGRARDVPATSLFREMGIDGKGWPQPVYLAAAAIIVALLVLLAVIHAEDRRIAATFVAAAVAAFLVLRGVGRAVQAIARRAPRCGPCGAGHRAAGSARALHSASTCYREHPPPGSANPLCGTLTWPWPYPACDAGAY